MSISSWIASGGDWSDSKYSRGWDGPVRTPDKADLTLSSVAPGGGQSHFISPDSTSFEIVQSYEWDQLTSSWVDSTGDWNTGPTPQMAVSDPRNPAKADLTFTAYSPAIGRIYNFVISAQTLTLTGQSPTDSKGFIISPENASIEIVQTYSWDNYGGTWNNASNNWDNADFIPTAVETGQNQPDAGSLTLAGFAPEWTLSQLWYVPSGSLSLTGFLPLSTTGRVFTPDSANLTGFGTTAWDDVSGTWASSSDAWGAGTLTPTAGITYTFSIDSAGNLVFTPYDPIYPIVYQPKYVPEIIIT